MIFARYPALHITATRRIDLLYPPIQHGKFAIPHFPLQLLDKVRALMLVGIVLTDDAMYGGYADSEGITTYIGDFSCLLHRVAP